MSTVEFGILGPLSATSGGTPIPLGPEKHRTLLACLLVRANQVVGVDELVDRLWGDDPPAGGRRVVHTYVTRLRKALGAAGGLVHTRPPGYLLEVPDGALDVAVFRQHVARAEAAADPVTQAAELRAGLALWRGEPLSDISSETLRRDEVPRLVEERMRALDRRIEVDLTLGRHAELVGELSGLVRRYPLRESLWGQLMLALHRSGRRAEALQAFQDIRATLRDELGLDPGEGLRAVHEEILTASTGPVPRWPAVRQLPADVGSFVGRRELVARVEELVRTAPIVVLSGPPGIGKTALAVHAGHRMAHDFPDGQLYVNLRGHSASAPMAPGDALARLLRALGIPPDQVPLEVDEQSSLFRSTLADRRMLVVLDNAVSPDHVRPLLPGSPSCPVLVTSRDQLRGLVAIDGARRLSVDVLTAAESMALLAGIAGPAPITAEPFAAQRLVELCGQLPLALRIAAANLSSGPHRTLAEYVEHLLAGNRLGALEIDGDDRSAVRIAFGQSYGTLKPELARVFRLLSLIPGPDFDAHTAANLAGIPLATATTLLDRLATANLIQRDRSGRYQFHDLIRDYAQALAQEYDTAAERAEAYLRLLYFYCYATDSMAELVYPEWLRLPVPPLPPGLEPVLPARTSIASGIDWFDEERANLVAALRESRPELAYVLAPLVSGLLGNFMTQRHDRDWLATFARLLADAEQTGDLRAQASMRFGLGQYWFTLTDLDVATAQFNRSAELAARCGDTVLQARSVSSVSVLLMGAGGRADTIEHLERALAMQVEIGDLAGECLTLLRMGTLYLDIGPLDRAVEVLSRAWTLSQELHFGKYAVNIAYFLGTARIAAGDPDGAIADFTASRELCRALRYIEGEADVLYSIAGAHIAAGRPEQAIGPAEEALELGRTASARLCELTTLVTLGAAYVAMARAADARANLGPAHQLATELSQHVELRRSEVLLAGSYRLDGDYQRALRAAPDPGSGTEPWCGLAHTELARIRLAMGDRAAARRHAERAVEICRAAGYRIDEARAREVLASVDNAG